ncbi:MAG TPA: hypothetical protein PLF78_08295 [Caulobacter sp.]|nr:hypothetical protein [Caulobacter sp.]
MSTDCTERVADADDLGPARFALSKAIDLHLTIASVLGPLFEHDQTSLLIFLDLLRASVSHVNGPARPHALAASGLLPDGLRRPVSMRGVSQRTNLPYETVRRHTLRLVERGYCDRVGSRGFVVPARVLNHPDIRRATLSAAPTITRSAAAIHSLADVEGAAAETQPCS